MPDYFLAPSLVKLRNEINERWPNRDKESDGWIGDASHAARKSDHNPDWGAPGERRGIVRALDIDKDGPDMALLLKTLIGHPAVNYVIYQRVIYSRVRDFVPKAYSGINAHEHHLHVSINHTVSAESFSGTWLPTPIRKERGEVDIDDAIRLGPSGKRVLNQPDGVISVEESIALRTVASVETNRLLGELITEIKGLREQIGASK